jgi:RNA polymerase sigma-70 factor (ECF subfamily)
VDPLSRLALRARTGDPRDLESFVEAGYEQVWRLCATIVGKQSADDPAQETFIRAVNALPQWSYGVDCAKPSCPSTVATSDPAH